MVLQRLLRRGKSPGKPVFAIPDGLRVYAIGDIHGRRDLLDNLVARIDRDNAARGPARVELVFLGDLVDRGDESAEVVEAVRDLKLASDNVRVLAGNHEEVFLGALAGDPKSLRMFIRIGGRETMRSYGISDREMRTLDDAALVERLRAAVPRDHVEFLLKLEDQIEVGDYVFVHAGIRPGRAMDAQSRQDLRWIRSEFLDHRDCHGRMIVHGHTIVDAVDIRSNRIGIDTGAYSSGVLTAIGLEGAERWFLQTGLEEAA